jgi:hypothetical protein
VVFHCGAKKRAAGAGRVDVEDHGLLEWAAPDQPEVLTIDGCGEIVVQHAAAYERLLAIVERAEAVAGVRRGLLDLHEGRTMSLDEFERRLRSGGKRKRSS